MTTNFDHAAANANQNCPKCKGTGNYCYASYGTPHYTICDLCCKHDKGYWKLEKNYGANNGKWCCLAGCGHCVDTMPGDATPVAAEELAAKLPADWTGAEA